MPPGNHILKFRAISSLRIFILLLFVATLAAFGFYYTQSLNLKQNVAHLTASESDTKKQLAATEKELTALKNENQYVVNQELKAKIKKIETTYKGAQTTYEKLMDLGLLTKTEKQDELFAEILSLLAAQNYASAEGKLTTLTKQIDDELAKTSPATSIAVNVPVNNTPPGSGYNRQQVKTDIGTFLVDIISADLSSTKVIVDTASDGDCQDNCPTLPLATYVSRNGAFAGVNGSYFCPAEYPSCVGKTNSFDTLLMNKNKVYFNSDNNVYSTVPAVIFGGGWVRFVGRSLEWGRDTGIDSMIANQPLVLAGNNVAFGGDGDPKKGSKGSRSFVANKGNTVYIGVVHNATVAEVGYALKGLGLDNGLNLDSGGSTALWSGGYKAGPGRNIPNAVLFVRK
ncbi:MAG: phosphodiester glycosidase family protein [Candidatus Levybacteria bacterium]|nr:phosphodiester glycosidase family protein [Candidatus Levybacteria bacterium]